MKNIFNFSKITILTIFLIILITSSSLAAAVTINFWSGFSGDDKDSMDGLVNKFNNSQSEVFVNWTTYQWDQMNSKVILSTAIGEPPDICAMWNTVMSEMARKDVLAPLDSFAVKFGIDGKDFVERAWKKGVIDGKRYGIPLDLHQLALFLNVDHFNQLNIPIPDEITSEEEFIDLAQKLTKDFNNDGTIDQWGVGILPTTQWPIRYWMALIHQQGGAVASEDLSKAAFNDKYGIKAMQFLVDLIKKYKVSPSNLADLNQGFLSGKISMIFNGPWMINSAKKQEGLSFKIIKFPKIYDNFVTWGMSHMLVLPKQNNNEKQEAAMKFLKYLEDNSLAWGIGGQLPARLSTLEDPAFKNLVEWQPFAASQPYTIMNPLVMQQTKIFTHDPTTPLVSAWESIVQGKSTVEEALAEAEKRFNEILSE